VLDKLAVSEVFGAVTVDPDAKEMWRTSLRHGAVGLEMGIAVALGSVGGWYLDDRYGTGPWLLIVGMGFGIAAGFKGLYRAAKEGLREAKRDEEEESEENGNDT
jgi:ATP synthase protein I